MSDFQANPYSAPAVPAIATAEEPTYEYISPEYAGGIGPRFFALLLDYGWTVLLGAIAGVLGVMMLRVLQGMGQISGEWVYRFRHQGAGAYVASAIAYNVYFALAQSIGGSTVGKVVLGLRVVTTEFRWPHLGQTLGRTLALFVDLLFFGIPAYSSMKDSEFRQRLGDRWAGTYVVKNVGISPSVQRSLGRVWLGILIGSVANLVVMIIGLVWNVL